MVVANGLDQRFRKHPSLGQDASDMTVGNHILGLFSITEWQGVVLHGVNNRHKNFRKEISQDDFADVV